MFLLFFNLYLAMFTGTWVNNSWSDIYYNAGQAFNSLGTFITSIFGDGNFNGLGDALFANNDRIGLLMILSLVLATITSIGIVVVATKGIKKLFTVFFYGVR